MAGLDEGVGNLERFIDGLRQGTAQLEDAASGFASAGRDFEKLEDDLDEAGGALIGALDEGTDALDTAADDAGAAIDELGEAAEDGVAGALVDAEESLDEECGACVEQAAVEEAGLEDAAARLTEAGFEALATALSSTGDRVASSAAEGEQALDGLADSCTRDEGRLSDASADAGTALDEASAEAGGEATELTGALSTAIESWTASVDGVLRKGCEEVGEALVSAYASWGEKAAAAAAALSDAVFRRVGDAAELLRGGARTLDQAADTGLDAPGTALVERLEQTGESLEPGTLLAQALQALVPDLQRSLDVVDQVDRLLNAVA